MLRCNGWLDEPDASNRSHGMQVTASTVTCSDGVEDNWLAGMSVGYGLAVVWVVWD